MSIHKNLDTSNGIHIPHAFSYADAATRAAASGFTSADLYKIARQEDDNSLWVLTATTPTWSRVGIDSNFSSVAQGDVIYHNGSDWVNLAKGTKGRVLQIGASIPAWGGKSVGFNIVGNAVAATGQAQYLHSGNTITLTKAIAKVGTVPAGNSIQIDVNKNGTTMLSRVLSIAAGASTATISSIVSSTPAELADGDEVTIDIDQIGSTTAGGNDTNVTLLF
jgi:hypothetical protein